MTMEDFSKAKLLDIYRKVQTRYEFQEVLKDEQIEGIYSLICGQNTLCVLPTGYGKSLIYSLLPLLWDEVMFNLIFNLIFISILLYFYISIKDYYLQI